MIKNEFHRVFTDYYSIILSLSFLRVNIFLCREYISSCTLITANFSYIPIASSFEFSNISIDRPCCCFVLIAPFFFPDTSLRPRPSYHQVVDYAFPPFFSPSLLFFFLSRISHAIQGWQEVCRGGKEDTLDSPVRFYFDTVSRGTRTPRDRQMSGIR